MAKIPITFTMCFSQFTRLMTFLSSVGRHECKKRRGIGRYWGRVTGMRWRGVGRERTILIPFEAAAIFALRKVAVHKQRSVSRVQHGTHMSSSDTLLCGIDNLPMSLFMRSRDLSFPASSSQLLLSSTFTIFKKSLWFAFLSLVSCKKNI